MSEKIKPSEPTQKPEHNKRANAFIKEIQLTEALNQDNLQVIPVNQTEHDANFNRSLLERATFYDFKKHYLDKRQKQSDQAKIDALTHNLVSVHISSSQENLAIAAHELVKTLAEEHQAQVTFEAEITYQTFPSYEDLSQEEGSFDSNLELTFS